MKIATANYSKRQPTIIRVDKFDGGYSSLIDEARMPTKFAVQALNLMQYQNGVWGTRWGFDYYGKEIPGETSIDGATEYIKSNGTRETIAIGGTTGKIYKSQDKGNWTQISATTFTPGKTYDFLQIRSELYICNGTDALSRYNGSTISTYAGLTAISDLSFTLTTLTTGSKHYYYMVTALNDVGETEGSNEIEVAVNKEREVFATGESVNLTWTAVSGAKRYNIYAYDQAGYEVFLGSSTTNSFVDVGTVPWNPFIEVPNDNTTSAPNFTTMEMSGNRIWATGDPDNPYRVYFTGVGQYLGFFSPFYGGGYIDLEKGGRETPVRVVHYRKGNGDSMATVLCSSPDGLGSIWQVDINSNTVDNFTFAIPTAYKIVGSIGSNATFSVVKAKDNIGFANTKGVFFLRNKPQMLNILTTDETSQPIRPDYRSLNQSQIGNLCAYYYEGKIFFSASEGSTNDIIFIYDLERNNWTYKWSRGVKRFFEYTENKTGDGRTHFLALPVSGNRLWEISENFEGDFGQPFYQGYLSPLIPVSTDKTNVLKLKESLVELGRPKGTLTYELLGLEAKKGFSTLSSRTITSSVSNSGMSTDFYSDCLMSDTTDAPSSFSQASVKKAIKIRKRVYAIQHKVYSQQANTKFQILYFQTKGRLLNKRTPSAWLQ